MLTCLVGTLAVSMSLGLVPASDEAGRVELSFRNGRVSLVARDATAQQILAEWERVGHTTIANRERVPGGTLTIELVDLPEKEALDLLLRSAAGYVAVSRPEEVAGNSTFGRIQVLPASTRVLAQPQPAQPVASSTQTPAPQPVDTPGVSAIQRPGESSGQPAVSPARRVRPAPATTRQGEVGALGGAAETSAVDSAAAAAAKPVAPAPQAVPPVGVPVPGMIVPVPPAQGLQPPQSRPPAQPRPPGVKLN